MFLSRRAYDSALTLAYERGLAAGERTLAVFREQLSVAHRQLDASIAREGERAQDVARFAAASAFPSAPPAGQTRSLGPQPQANLRRRLEEMDPFAEVPIGDPRGSFKEAADAMVMPPDLGDALRRTLGDEVANGRDQ